MRWADQLIKLSNFELEVLQTRLAEIVERRTRLELRMAVLLAEGEAETALARTDPEAAWRLPAFNEGLKQRKAAVQRDIDRVAGEEAGARDALAEAFETLKKYEHVAEANRVTVAREAARRETAVLDELGLRRAVAGRG
ncbi:MAG TPA: flagellar export protein FliJ [Caulobacteraceae bacterium]|nr:flagellar export protein FliJ [Caulobacteraceae bacterium]